MDLRPPSSEAKCRTFSLSGLWNATGPRVPSLEGLAWIHLEGFISHTLIGTCVSPEAMDKGENQRREWRNRITNRQAGGGQAVKRNGWIGQGSGSTREWWGVEHSRVCASSPGGSCYSAPPWLYHVGMWVQHCQVLEVFFRRSWESEFSCEISGY